jgi:hypothetical protein
MAKWAGELRLRLRRKDDSIPRTQRAFVADSYSAANVARESVGVSRTRGYAMMLALAAGEISEDLLSHWIGAHT